MQTSASTIIRDAHRIASGDMTPSERLAYARGGAFFRTATPAERRLPLCEANPFTDITMRLAWAAGFSDACLGRSARQENTANV